jgi:hypothetical protein
VNAAELQTAFLKQIKNQLPSHLALVDAITEQLNLSNDSAYRRIRGEKHLTFDEIQILAAHYKISLDSFLHLQNNSLIFWGKILTGSNLILKIIYRALCGNLNILCRQRKNKCFI